MIRASIVSVVVCLAALGAGSCESSDSGASNNWGECTGSHGRQLSCGETGARPIVGARYDMQHQCFDAPASLPEYCAVPTYCPGGGGELTCIIDPSGEAHVIYILYGEETTQPSWHHDSTTENWDNTLTSKESALCASLFDAVRASASAADAGADAGEGTDGSALPFEQRVQFFPRCE